MAYAAAGAAGGAAVGSVIPGIGTGIGAGLGAIGGGLLDFFGAQSANAQNWDEFVSNQVWNTNEINQGREYNTWMANTAHQREKADLEAAGLNPILAANQGAPSPSSPMTNPGTGSPMQNAGAGLGRAMGSAIPSALSAASAIKDIENVDADITLKHAQALTEASRKDQATWSARQLEEETSKTAAERSLLNVEQLPRAAEGQARINRAKLDLENEARERILGQIKTGTSSAADIVGSIVKAKQPGLTQQQIDLQGLKGEPVPRRSQFDWETGRRR